MCLEIPDTHIHVYYSRESDFSPPSWTGNSNRSGYLKMALKSCMDKNIRLVYKW
jgi:hypothetical protein